MDAPCVVICDSCSRPAYVAANVFGGQCPTPGCISVLLKPAELNKRITCNEKPCYQYVDLNTKIVHCANCQEEFEIGPMVVETRCRQKVYGVARKNPLEEQIRKLKSELSAKEEATENLKVENSALRVKTDTLESELQQATEDVGNRQKENDRLLQENNELTEKLNECKKEYENNKEVMTEWMKKSEFDDGEKKKLSLEWLKAEEELVEMKSQKDQLQQTLSECNHDFEIAKLENTSLKANVDKLVEELRKATEESSNQQREYDELAAEFNRYKQEHENIKEECKQLKNKVELESQERKKVTSKVALEQTLNLSEQSPKEDEVSVLSMENVSLKAKVAELEAEVKKLTETLNCQTNDFDLLVDDKLELIVELNAMKKRLENNTEQRDQLMAELDSYASENEAANKAIEQVDKLMTTNMNLSEAMTALTKLVQNPVDLKKAEDEIVELKQKMKEMEAKHNEKMKTLERLLKEMFGEFHGHLDLVDKKELKKNEQTETTSEKSTEEDELKRLLSVVNDLASLDITEDHFAMDSSLDNSFASILDFHNENIDLRNKESLEEAKKAENSEDNDENQDFGAQFELEKQAEDEHERYDGCLSPMAFTPPESPSFDSHESQEFE